MSAGASGLFLACLPGVEPYLLEEVHAQGFAQAERVSGGVEVAGGWPEVWRANLGLRCCDKVLLRIASFRAMHPAQLDKRARKVDWRAVLPAGASVQVDAVCRASKIYHQGAARDRVKKAIRDALGPGPSAPVPYRISVRIDDDLCTISLDTSGEPLHRRGYKQAVGKAPMRDTLAAAFLRACDYRPGETVVDPMCGSGTFLLEAAGRAQGLLPGARRRFAFAGLPAFDQGAFDADIAAMHVPASEETAQFHGADRDAGAIRSAEANAARAGLRNLFFTRAAISDLTRPEGPPGLVIVNPPYGARIGNRKMLFALYGALGKTLKERFSGWRVGVVTSDPGLAKATALNLSPMVTVPHGGLQVQLWRAKV